MLEVILDTCYSCRQIENGTAHAKKELLRDKPIQTRYLSPPSDILCRYEGEEDELGPISDFMSTLQKRKSCVLWISSKGLQKSEEVYIKDGYNGLFTYYLCQHFRETDVSISRKSLLERIQESIKNDSFSQVPVLQCTARALDAECFAI